MFDYKYLLSTLFYLYERLIFVLIVTQTFDNVNMTNKSVSFREIIHTDNNQIYLEQNLHMDRSSSNPFLLET